MDPFIGQILLFAGNFAPRGWALCQGQLLPIAQNSALFSILGTTYGGDGRTTFALPDLRGRVPVSSGQGPGLSPYTLGENGGTEQVTLLSTQMPAHTHVLVANNTAGTRAEPEGNVLAAESAGATQIYSDASATVTMNPVSISATGGSQPHSNLQPFLCLNYIIALEGIYPSRN
jgi:microcystin-dependent protein